MPAAALPGTRFEPFAAAAPLTIRAATSRRYVLRHELPVRVTPCIYIAYIAAHAVRAAR